MVEKRGKRHSPVFGVSLGVTVNSRLGNSQWEFGSEKGGI